MDVVVVPKSRADEPENLMFEPGTKGYLYQQPNGTYRHRFDPVEVPDFEGGFFKYRNTDFDNGIFSFFHKNKVYEFRVNEGVVSPPVNIK